MLKPKLQTTWIVVADGARARFFTPGADAKKLVSALPADIFAPEARGHASDLKSDKPGRGYSSSRSGARHALEPPHDYHKLEKHKFSAELAKVLEGACERREFDRLVLVAPHRSLGELRTLLSDRVKRLVGQEIAKDLTNETVAGLWRRLAPLLKPGR
ncbi:MAG: host attachment protein [Reyranellales bacterium]